MLIKIEVPDDVIMLHVHGCNYDGVIVKRGYVREELQSMIVSDEPCEWCAIEAEIEPSCIECIDVDCTATECQDCNDYSAFKPTKHYCGYCGRDFRKDVEHE